MRARNLLFRTRKPVGAGCGHAPNYLPGLGSVFVTEKVYVVLCRDCGLVRWFARSAALQNARSEALQKLSESGKWKRV